MTPRPRICCLDLDTFFVSVERILDPSLEGKPVVVGGARGARGVVTACSYEVRAFGVRSGMSLTEADRLAPPHAVFMSGTSGVYSDYAQKVRDIASSFTPESRVASIDEMYLDFRGCELLYREPRDVDDDATIERVVRSIASRIRDELQLPASCGIASSKPVAKVASGVAKPAGVRLVRGGEEAAFLAPLPVRKLPGIGPVAEARLHELGITTLGEVADAPMARLRPIFGSRTEGLLERARGGGVTELGRERPHFREHDPVGETVGSISNERTFREDLSAHRDVEARLCGLVERVCWRARNRNVKARTVTLKLRYSDFQTLTRARTISATSSEADVLPVVLALYRAARTRRTAIRLVGIKLSKLVPQDAQLELFSPREPLHRAVDTIREKYGFDAVRSLSGTSGSSRKRRPDADRSLEQTLLNRPHGQHPNHPDADGPPQHGAAAPPPVVPARRRSPPADARDVRVRARSPRRPRAGRTADGGLVLEDAD
jgi:DNA polymerase-4